MNLVQFKSMEVSAVSMQSWCSHVTRHPEGFSEDDRDVALFMGRWMWSSHVLHETNLIPPTQAEALVGYMGSTYQVQKCPLASTYEVWSKVYFNDSTRDLEVQVGDYLSVESAIEAVEYLYSEAIHGLVAYEMAPLLAAA